MRALLAAFFVVLALPTAAVEPKEVLADPALEARAREISKELRCLVCQNQSIDDSNADLARDLRVLVRERLTQGDSDDQVLDYLVKRYGDYVLLKPPVKSSTYVLWFGPLVILILGIVGLFFFLRGRRPAAAVQTAALSEDEKRRIDTLLHSRDQKDG